MKVYSVKYPIIDPNKCRDLGIQIGSRQSEPVITAYDVTPANGKVSNLCKELESLLASTDVEIHRENLQGFLNSILIDNYGTPANPAYQRRKVSDRNFIGVVNRYIKYFNRTNKTTKQ